MCAARRSPRPTLPPFGAMAPLTVLACAAVSGCAIPDYHQPAGFSSTYYRALQAVAPLGPAPTAVAAPPSASPGEPLPRTYLPPVNPSGQ